MTKIARVLAAMLVLLTGLWLLADTLVPQPFSYFAFRAKFMQYSGVLAIGAMSLCMVLAVRPRWLEPYLGGLDKMYRLHKWLGITALVTSVAHWWLGQGTKWMVGWGWLIRPARRPRTGGPDPATLEGLFRTQRGLAETVGEWAFYAAAVLLVLALIKRFPYRWFAKTHTVLAALYLCLVFHSVILLQFSYWLQPVGLLMAVLMAVGSVCGVQVLSGRVGARRQVRGTVALVQPHPASQLLETRIELQPGWPGHQAGQFAFVTFDKREGAHPFTIASAWSAASRQVTFLTKALGDYTQAMPQLIQVGGPVTVEGPYGCFQFDDHQPRQIWIGAGIGITPFMARLKQLAAQGVPGQAIDLFHASAVYEPAVIDQLRADAAAAGVRLHLFIDARDGRLDAEKIRASVPGWKESSIWFCGPTGMGTSLWQRFKALGLSEAHFHRELFEMR